MTATTSALGSREERHVPPMGGFSATLLRIELRRLLRNRRAVIFTVVMPVVFFLIFGVGQKYSNDNVGHGNGAAYVMISMAIYGAMIATTSGGAMVSIERSLGWSRQLRLTPLSPVAYVATKMVTAMTMGLASVVATYCVGAMSHAHMDPRLWLVTGLIAWVGSLVFAAFGLFMGYLLPSDNVMQILGPVLALLAFGGGLFIPLEQMGSTFRHIAELTPMYGVNQLVHAPLTGTSFDALWLVNLLVWLALFVAGAAWRFRKDTARV
ncbi:ABC transporter permease [Oryzihumus leptocrescens]|uniref:ABC-2 type transport system permease protein n=1 Tax=Oryzihumus leptocrescens TaxID=297536 RepID=A0A542ZHN9_9MICO|nr:ABC transporter permease [Oryzihumus leptocrescens]TQL59845.1 ABC-2 type transport system permease protein [Oryzihumus leptocrescens]